MITFVLWVLTGVLLWMRAMRKYGRGKEFHIFGDYCHYGSHCQKFTACSHNVQTPAVRLACHVIFAPVYLVAVFLFNVVWRALKAVGRVAERFAEWYAPPEEESE